MTARSADAIIKGYYYQFDTSILKILELNADSDYVVIEEIEDIDINSATEYTAVQCKYLSKPQFTNSSVRKPITLMLEHFINSSSSNNYNYILYSHFENAIPGEEPLIDLERLKDILTYTEKKVAKFYHTDNGITDVQLSDFLNHFKLAFGKEFYKQQTEVIGELKTIFNCSHFEADTLYYNNALRIIIDRAIKKNSSERKITKADFIASIDCSQKLFNEWFIKLRSKEEYLKLAAQGLKSTRALDPVRTKLIVIGKELLNANNSELPIQSLIENLISKYYKLNSALRDAKPLAIVLDCDFDTLTGIKEYLISHDIVFNDGYEGIAFSSLHFNRGPLITTNNTGNRILKSSYLIKLISRSCFLENISAIQKPTVLLNFSREDLPAVFKTSQYFDFKYCENLKDINRLLT